MAEYIERNAAILAVCEEQEMPYHRLIGGSTVTVFAVDVKERIKKIPAADVAPVRHGRWLETTQPMGWSDVTCAECSECGEDFVLDEWGMEDVKNLMHYCPNCGAKIDLTDN